MPHFCFGNFVLSFDPRLAAMPSRLICTTTCVLISLCSRAASFLLSSPSPVSQRSSAPPGIARWCPTAGAPRRSVKQHTAIVYSMNL